ncbi:cytochrome c-type biogenesis CcmF C-terminal domain-containing protein, partial [Rhizobium leguminosarum]|uniref:cytochrome c-type biogenesis CcmF C-terminal domain-containing protein n=1 Tax=Rhizobium leguminosarum TaxID=384 RepID=UPI003F985D7E
LLETLTGDKISVGAPFFNLTFGLLMAPLIVIVPFGPILAWKRGDLLGALQRLYVVEMQAVTAGLGHLPRLHLDDMLAF